MMKSRLLKNILISSSAFNLFFFVNFSMAATDVELHSNMAFIINNLGSIGIIIALVILEIILIRSAKKNPKVGNDTLQKKDDNNKIMIIVLIVVVLFSFILSINVGSSSQKGAFYMVVLCLIGSLLYSGIFALLAKFGNKDKKDARKEELIIGLKFSIVFGCLTLFWIIMSLL